MQNKSYLDYNKNSGAAADLQTALIKAVPGTFEVFRHTSNSGFHESLKSQLEVLFKNSRSTNVYGRIEAAFHLFFEQIPHNLSYYIRFALKHDASLFPKAPEYLLRGGSTSEHRALRLFESPLNALKRLTGEDPYILVNHLHHMSISPENLLCSITNIGTPTIMNIIETMIYLRMHQVAEGLIPLREKERNFFLAEKIYSLGCSKALSRKVSGLHYNTLSDLFYKDSEDATSYSIQRHTKVGAMRMMEDKSKCAFTMLMLGLYNICCRILNGVNGKEHNYNYRHVPKNTSYALAAGVYSCALMLYENICFKYWRDHPKHQIMPDFDEFVEIVGMYSQNLVEAVACSDCHTPYLLYCDESFNCAAKRKGRGLSCPKCEQSLEYVLNEQA